MKDIYIQKTKIYINLKNYNQIFVPQEGRSMYRYGDMPENQNIKIEGEEDGFKSLIVNAYCPRAVTPFAHRQYIFVPIDSSIRSYKKIYKSQINSVLILHRYEKIENPRIEQLKKDLDFYTYSQLIFDREQELRRMLTE